SAPDAEHQAAVRPRPCPFPRRPGRRLPPHLPPTGMRAPGTSARREPRRCPKCNMKLLARGIPRRLRFHDLRATTATLLARAGVSLVIAQRILRHSDPRPTADGHAGLHGVDRWTL